MFAKFFINRPVLSIVISVVILICGAISIFNLPIEQYPDLLPPTISVEARYPGASAEVISNTVSSLLENKINGVEDMIYMNTVASADNGMSVTSISFKVGSDPDKAMINVNNRVQMVMNSLPNVVKQYGVTVNKRSSAILKVMAMYSTSSMYDAKYLGNYAIIQCIDALKRIKGVGDAQVLSGNDYAMRIWIKPDVISKLNLSTREILASIKSQNTQRAAGKIGQQPIDGTDKFYTIIANGRYTDAEQFKNIIIRSDENGANLKLQDIADIELGAQSYEIDGKTQGCPAVPIMFFLSPGANALETVKLVDEKMTELAKKFPDGIHYKTVFDTTKFVEDSIKEVIKTLLEAVFLVVLVILLFLKRFRATIIPCLAVPVSIIGAFAGMLAFGFSINTLTLFGLILAIGIVVDDAIIVIENVERIKKAENLPIKEATEKAVEEVVSPVIAIVLVLCAVFIPVAFIGGLSGVMYRQFAITIVISVVISGIVALTLTPALCVMFLGGHSKEKTGIIFKKFDQFYEAFSTKYLFLVQYLTENRKHTFMIISGIMACILLLFKFTPSSLLPNEDQGVCMSCAFMDPGASLSRASRVANYMDYIAMNDPAVEDCMCIAGYDMISGSAKNNSVTMFMKLKSFEQRRKVSLSSFSVVGRMMALGARATDALIIGFNPPPIVGMSTTGGFECYLQAADNATLSEMNMKTQEILMEAAKRKELTGLSTSFNASSPQFKLNVDEQKALSFGVDLDDLYLAIESSFGTAYVNDFTHSGRTFKVLMQAKSDYRSHHEKIDEIYVKSKKGHMIPVTAFVTLEQIIGCDTVSRFNNKTAAKIIGNPAPGYTSGQAMDAIEEVFHEKLNDQYDYGWAGSSFQEKEASGTGMMAVLTGIIFVFLILAAQYESWSLPIAVMLSIPFAMLGALLAVFLRGYSNDLYFQIALITLIGLTAKNAILIVEFAVILRQKGEDLMSAALHAVRLRLRPIVMTSLAFIFGCLPLAISTGAGAASRHSLGTGIIGGMIGATFIAPLFVPLFFIIVSSISEKLRRRKI